MDIRYREVRESDIPVLADLIWRTWASPDARRMLHEVGLVLDREGNQCRNAWHALWQAFRNAKAELDKSSSEDHGAEITLFAVDEVYRGQGIGTGLFNKAMSALQMSGIERFYLHSDAFSSHGFYEKRGMELVDRRPSIVSIGDKANVEIFIYMDSVERQL